MIDKFEFIKECFYKEEERRESLNNGINIPITIMTGILGIIYFLTREYLVDASKGLIGVLFYCFLFATVAFWLVSLFFLLKSYNNFFKGYNYRAFPNNFIEEEYQNQKSYFNTYKEELEPELSIDKVVEEMVIEVINTCVIFNSQINKEKVFYLYRSKTQIVFCILFLFLSTICLCLNLGLKNNDKQIHSQVIISDIMSDKKTPPPPPRPAQQPIIVKQTEFPIPPK